MDKERLKLALVRIGIEIDEFEFECEENQHTDTDQVWDLLRAFRKEILDTLKETDQHESNDGTESDCAGCSYLDFEQRRWLHRCDLSQYRRGAIR